MLKQRMITIAVLLALVLGVCGCSQQAAEMGSPEEAEPVEDVVTDPVADVKADEQLTDGAETEVSAADGQDQAAAEPQQDETALPEGISQEEWDLVMADARKWLEEKNGSSPSSSADTQQSGEPSSGEEPRALSDAEVQATLDHFLATFKSTDAYKGMSERALQYLEKNLNIIRDDPMSDPTVGNFLDDYRKGFLSREEFEFALREWVAGGGDLPGVEIYVQ